MYTPAPGTCAVRRAPALPSAISRRPGSTSSWEWSPSSSEVEEGRPSSSWRYNLQRPTAGYRRLYQDWLEVNQALEGILVELRWADLGLRLLGLGR